MNEDESLRVFINGEEVPYWTNTGKVWIHIDMKPQTWRDRLRRWLRGLWR